MRQITSELLEENGFESNHPEYLLKHYFLHSKTAPEWRVDIKGEYVTGTNNLSYSISCWKCNDKGFITKRASLSFVDDYDEVKQLCDLCGINLS